MRNTIVTTFVIVLATELLALAAAIIVTGGMIEMYAAFVAVAVGLVVSVASYKFD